jgi:thiosulfate dehydrogenase [quinone] large subunit
MAIMIMNWLRGSKYAAVILTLVRLYVGYEFLKAGWHKITGDKGFDASGFLKGAVAKPVMESGTQDLLYPNFVAFLKHFALPNVKLFNVIVPWGELFIGLGLIIGALTTAAVFFGMVMNFTFMLAGTVSSNPWLILLSIFIVVAGANAGKFGADYYILPYIRQWFGKLRKHDKHEVTGTHIKPHLN